MPIGKSLIYVLTSPNAPLTPNSSRKKCRKQGDCPEVTNVMVFISRADHTLVKETASEAGRGAVWHTT